MYSVQSVVFSIALPAEECVPTLCLMRRRMHLSRELVDDVVRARSRVRRWRRPDGLCVHETPLFDGSKRHGLARSWYENGTLRWERDYRNDNAHGLERLWYDDGVLASATDYVDGQIYGRQRTWFANGACQSEMEYRHHKRHGLSRWWSVDGLLKQEARYEDDRRVYGADYDHDDDIGSAD